MSQFNVQIYIYKSDSYSDSYSQDGTMDDPIFQQSEYVWDGELGQSRDIHLYARNDGTETALAVVLEVVDIDGSDESAWSKLATTKAGLDAASPGNSLAVGNMVVNGTFEFWMRMAVPQETDPEDKTDLKLRATVSLSSSSSSSSTSSCSSSQSSESSSNSSESSISSHSSSSSTSQGSSSESSISFSGGIHKGLPFIWPFKLVLTGTKTPATGKVPTITIYKEGGLGFVALTSGTSYTEIGNGWYIMPILGDDSNYNHIILKAEADGCEQADQAFYPE